MRFHTIVTHEYPDLDAMLCCYLLKKYGGNRYIGIEEAKIQYCPAGKLPEGKSPKELEEEGILAVDIGGGRLDTHPDGNTISEEKKTLSAANLVARDVGVSEEERFLNLLEFARIHDSLGKSLRSRNPIDHLFALPNLIRGASFYFGKSFLDITQFFFKVFEAIELAHGVEKEIFFSNEECLLEMSEDTIFVAKRPTIKNLFAYYLVDRYMPKKYRYEFERATDNNISKYHTISEVLAYCDVENHTPLKKIIDFVEQIRPGRFLLSSKFAMDETVSLLNIICGLYIKNNHQIDKCLKDIFQLLDYIVAHEENWYNAIDEYQEKRLLFVIRKAKVVAVSAKLGTVAKVARWLDKADLTIFHDEEKHHIAVSVNRMGKLRKLRLGRLAAKMRTAEIQLDRELDKIKNDDLNAIGEIAGWFLHQSEKLLIHGSPKAHRESSKIDFSTVTEIVLSEIDFERKLPDMFCPAMKCTRKKCSYYSLRLPNCFHHRRLCDKNAKNSEDT